MARKTTKPKSYMTPNEVAELLMVSPTTVRQWSSEGKIPSLVTPGGHRRFLHADIDRFARERGLTLRIPEDNEVMRVLIVDDNEEVVKYLTRVFDRLGGRVEANVARNGFDAGILVHSFKPHVVLLDLMMPGMDGFEVCRSIKRDPTSAATRVIGMTGYYDDTNVQSIMEAGAENCLSKPISVDMLLEAIGIDRKLLSA